MARPKHELQQTAEVIAKELDPRGDSMKQLSQYVWHDNPPFATRVDPEQAEQMFELLMRSPAGLMTLTQKFGQHKVQEIQQELVRQGKLSPGVLTGGQNDA